MYLRQKAGGTYQIGFYYALLVTYLRNIIVTK